MPFDEDTVNRVYDKTNGYCAYCRKKLAFSNYGVRGAKGSWHIDHSRSKSNGGSDYLRNLVPACINCNMDKSDRNGSHYKKKFEYVTWGGQMAHSLGLPEGFLGSSRRKKFAG